MAAGHPTTPSSSRCFLMEIPAELRCVIYDLLFGTGRICLSGHAGKWVNFTSERSMTDPAHVSALLLSCRLICQEALPVLYHNTRFNIVLNCVGRYSLRDAVARGSSPEAHLRADLITHVSIHTTVGESENEQGEDEHALECVRGCLQQLDQCRRTPKLALVLDRYS